MTARPSPAGADHTPAGADHAPSGADHSEALHDIERELTVLLHRVRRRTVRNAQVIHPELQPSAYPVLLHVVDHGPTRAADIVEYFGLDKSAISRQLTHLGALGLVARATDPDDRRASVLKASAFARRRVATLRRQRRAAFADKLSSWSDAELAGFAEQLARYNASLDPGAADRGQASR